MARPEPNSVDALIKNSRALLLWVCPPGANRFPPALSGFFDAEYPGGLRYGLLPTDAGQGPAWWRKRLRNKFSQLPAGCPGDGATGFYLFLAGEPRLYAADTGATALSEAEALNAVDLLEAQIDSLPEGRGALSWMRANAPARSAPSAEPPRPPPPAPPPPPPPVAPVAPGDDPWSLLGLDPTTDAKSAQRHFREKIKANHSDKLVHIEGLDPAILRFAEDRTARITAAWATICAQRGW